jgi:hypothetical protein
MRRPDLTWRLTGEKDLGRGCFDAFDAKTEGFPNSAADFGLMVVAGKLMPVRVNDAV